MRVFIKNKLMSLRGSSQVCNEQNEPIFKVKGKLISPTHKKKMYNANGELLYIIRNKYWTMFTNKVYVYDKVNKARVATIKKNKFSFNAKYEIQDCVDDMEIAGEFFSRTSQIIKNGQPVATITRDFSIVKDAFILDAEEKDIAFFTALVIALDNIKDKAKNNK